MSDATNSVPMFDVMPVTGTLRNSGRFCAVCALGGAPAMAVFIQKELLEGDLLEKVQEISDKYQALQVFVVVLHVPKDEADAEALKADMRRVASEKALRIPLTLLPEGQIPALLPINRDAGNNVFFYHGQRPFKNYADYDFDNFKLEKTRTRSANIEYKSGSSTLEYQAAAAPAGGDVSVLEDTASEMLNQFGMA